MPYVSGRKKAKDLWKSFPALPKRINELWLCLSIFNHGISMLILECDSNQGAPLFANHEFMPNSEQFPPTFKRISQMLK